jgi:hypothetical protein
MRGMSPVVKRVAQVFGLAMGSIVALAGQALAAYPPTTPPHTGSEPSSPPPQVAFTGANITVGLIILASLVVLGAVLLLAGRRRRASVGK